MMIATPRILAAEYARIRRQIEPGDGRAPADQRGGKGKRPQSGGTPAQIVIQTAQGDTVVAAPALVMTEVGDRAEAAAVGHPSRPRRRAEAPEPAALAIVTMPIDDTNAVPIDSI